MSVHICCVYQTFMPTAVTVRMLADFGINSKYRFIWEAQNGIFDKPDSTMTHKGMVQWHFSLNLF